MQILPEPLTSDLIKGAIEIVGVIVPLGLVAYYSTIEPMLTRLNRWLQSEPNGKKHSNNRPRNN